MNIKEVKKYIVEDLGYDDKSGLDFEDIKQISYELDSEGLTIIDISDNSTISESDYWLEGSYFSKKLQKRIIIGEDIPRDFDSIDDFLEYIERMEEEAEALEEKITLKST